MSKLEQIEEQISALSPDEFASLRAWLEEFEEDLWDKQIEADALAGRLDHLGERALKAYAEGRTTPLNAPNGT